MKKLYLHPKILPFTCPKILRFWNSKAHAILLSGPVESSKTTPILFHIVRLHIKYPNFKSLIVRTKYTDIGDSIVSTLFHQMLRFDAKDSKQPFKVHGYPSSVRDIWWDNGGQTAFRGIDAHRSKIMGSEWDLIFYNQIEDSPAAIIPDLMGRASGRAGNWIVDNKRMHQFIGDANPSTEFHHIYEMKNRGVFDWYDIMHDSNPRLFRNGEYTESGIATLEYLESVYTGVEYLRKVKGLWKSGEGLVYPQYDPAVHDITCYRDDFGPDTKWYLSVDFGGESPQACGLYAVTGTQKILFKEIYQHIPTIREYIDVIYAMLNRYNVHPAQCWVDHLTEHRNQLVQAGFHVTKADKEILAGVESVRRELIDGTLKFNKLSLDYLDQSLTGKPKRVTDELKIYAMKTREKQMTSAKPDHPAENQIDHGCDHLRYFVKGINAGHLSVVDMSGAYYNPPQIESSTIL